MISSKGSVLQVSPVSSLLISWKSVSEEFQCGFQSKYQEAEKMIESGNPSGIHILYLLDTIGYQIQANQISEEDTFEEVYQSLKSSYEVGIA
jgi:hypothetical protein